MTTADARAILFLPAPRLDRLDKALGSGADLVVVDLEDAVPQAGKAAAREAVVALLAAGTDRRVGVRINGIATREGLLDLAAVAAGPSPAFVLLPKVESAAEAGLYARHLPGVPLIATVESAAGLLRAAEIAAMPGVVALGFGGADLSADLGADLAWEPMLAHRATVVRAAAAAGVASFDVPHLDLADDDGLVDTTRRARAMGFTGRFAIHPRQVPGIVAAFTPRPAEVARARAVLAASAAAGGGVCELDGRMIDRPVVEAARRLLARAPDA